MTEMRTWTADEARAAVAKALASRSSPNPWYLADIVLAALGISGDVTVVPGRLEPIGIADERRSRIKVYEGMDELVDDGDFFVYRVVPARVVPAHAEPVQP